jgi:hypothetical protein
MNECRLVEKRRNAVPEREQNVVQQTDSDIGDNKEPFFDA